MSVIRQRHINNIGLTRLTFITDYDVLQSSALSSVEINDSINYKGYPIYYKDKLYFAS